MFKNLTKKKRNQQDAIAKKLEEKFQFLQEKFQVQGERLQSLEQGVAFGNTQLGEMNQNIGNLKTAVLKHDMAIEDLLEEWDEKQSDTADIKERFREYEQAERHLLDLFEAYQEQFWNLRRFADANDEAWSNQLTLMEKNLEHFRQLCAITIIGGCGTEVDYDLHEVIEAAVTSDSEQDKHVAAVYRCGYLYKGKVMKKAQVCAYRLGEADPAEDKERTHGHDYRN